MIDPEDWATVRVAELHAAGETGAAVGFVRLQLGFDRLGPFTATVGAIDCVVVRADQTIERQPVEARAQCARCGVFLSAARVEMRIDRCSNCDGHGARRGPRR